MVAMADTENSGNVVAMLTIVAPMMTFGTWVASAIFTAASVNQSAPLPIRATATANSNRSRMVLIIDLQRATSAKWTTGDKFYLSSHSASRIVEKDAKVKLDL
jgi:hypothetical protein